MRKLGWLQKKYMDIFDAIAREFATFAAFGREGLHGNMMDMELFSRRIPAICTKE